MLDLERTVSSLVVVDTVTSLERSLMFFHPSQGGILARAAGSSGGCFLLRATISSTSSSTGAVQI
jgi:hypothetical protein